METNNSVRASRTVILLFALLNIIVLRQGYIGDGQWYFALTLTIPLLLFALSTHWFDENADGYNQNQLNKSQKHSNHEKSK